MTTPRWSVKGHHHRLCAGTLALWPVASPAQSAASSVVVVMTAAGHRVLPVREPLGVGQAALTTAVSTSVLCGSAGQWGSVFRCVQGFTQGHPVSGRAGICP